jgi:hypothetical protein
MLGLGSGVVRAVIVSGAEPKGEQASRPKWVKAPHANGTLA